VRKLDAAVQSLANSGIVDPSRVGLIGFSRAGYMTYYAVTLQGRYGLPQRWRQTGGLEDLNPTSLCLRCWTTRTA